MIGGPFINNIYSYSDALNSWLSLFKVFAFPKQLINQSYIQHPMQIELIKGLIKCFIFELFFGNDLAVFNGFNVFIIALSKQVAIDSNYNTVMLVAKNRLDNLR